jgi:hypothetical protein
LVKVLRRQLFAEAKEKCTDLAKDFSDCSKEQGLMVIFNCRGKSDVWYGCLHKYYNEVEFKQYALERGFYIQPPKPQLNPFAIIEKINPFK